MTSGRYGLVLREVGRLLEGGTAASLGAGPLLERFAADRDGAAFEALVSRHGPMVLGTCRRMLADPLDVEDAFQATFLVLARKAGSIQDADRLGPWLHGVARRVAARSRALSGRRKSVERPGIDDPAVESPDLLEGSEVREILDEELSRLPEKYRAPLVLCYLEGLTHDEAAEHLRWPVGTVRSRLSGGRDRLRTALTRRGFAPSAAVPAILARASIPQALLTTTVRVATAAGSPSAQVLNLAKGALIAMTWNKLNLIAAIALTAGLTVGGAGVAAQKDGGGKAEAPAAEKPATIIEQISDERDRVKVELNAVVRKIEQIRYNEGKEIREFEKRQADLKSHLDDLERRWKALTANADGGASVPADEAKKIENWRRTNMKLFRERGQIQQQVEEASRKLEELKDLLGRVDAEWKNFNSRGVVDPSADARPEKTASGDRPKMEAIPKPSSEPQKIEAPIAPGEETSKPATKAPQPELYTLPGEPKLFATISTARDLVTIFDPEAKTRKTYRPPSGLSVGKVYLGAVTALSLVGPEIAQLVVFDRNYGQWSTQDLKRPVSGKSVELLKPGRITMGSIDIVKYQIDGSIYLYSPAQAKWTSLELRVPVRSPMTTDGEIATLIDGDLIHIYDARTAEWKHIDTKGEK